MQKKNYKLSEEYLCKNTKNNLINLLPLKGLKIPTIGYFKKLQIDHRRKRNDERYKECNN